MFYRQHSRADGGLQRPYMGLRALYCARPDAMDGRDRLLPRVVGNGPCQRERPWDAAASRQDATCVALQQHAVDEGSR
jgi:hypothetical protein